MKKIFKNPFVIAFFVGIASLHIVKEMSLARRAAPPPLVTVGRWSLLDHNGHPFGSDNLAGKVVVASFFFTRCPSICPKLQEKMSEVYKRFENDSDVVLVSFSVDPTYDTPQVLRNYREKNKFNQERWIFVTGTQDEMIQVVMNQMKLNVGERQKIPGLSAADELFDISHVGELILLDQNGDLRGKISTDPMGLAAIVRSAKFLIEKGP